MKSKFEILVIDDEQIVIDSVKKILHTEGFIIDGLLNADTVMQKLQKNNYKLILVDLMLPKISGLNVIAMIKKEYPDLLIILFTGYATRENTIEAFKAGAFDFVQKPFDFEELLSLLQRAVCFEEKKIAAPTSNSKVSPPKEHDGQNEPEQYYLLGVHAWAKIEQDHTVTVGAGEAFCNTVGDIREIQLPALHEEIFQGNMCVKIFTPQDQVHTVWMPLSGTVIESNKEKQNGPTLINTGPFGSDWLVRIRPTNLETELDNLTLRSL